VAVGPAGDLAGSSWSVECIRSSAGLEASEISPSLAPVEGGSEWWRISWNAGQSDRGVGKNLMCPFP
jgi:hypothetical protein